MVSHPDPNNLLDAVAERAGRDAGFRRQLLAEPAAAVRATYGVDLPAGFRVRFLEKPADVDVLVVLPEMSGSDNELTDDDLDDVAGGTAGNHDEWSDAPPLPPPPPPGTP